MVKLSWIFLLSVIAVFTVQFAQGYIIIGSSIKDLERSDNCFISDAAYWTVSSVIVGSNKYTKCSETYLLGGYGVLGSISTQNNDYFRRDYYGLPSHTMVYFTMRIWAIDNWQFGEIPFILQIDGTSFPPVFQSLNSNYFSGDYCGRSGYNDLPDIRIFGRAFHNGPSMSFTVISHFDQDSQRRSFGFRDMSLMFATPSTLLTQTICGKASVPIMGGFECPCNDGQYPSMSSCVSCHPSCASCFGPGSHQCYECKTGYFYDGTSCNVCDASCSTCNGPLPTDCLSCRSGSYLFNTGCVSCSLPLSIVPASECNDAYCQSPCSVSDFLYWDQTCFSTCPFPLQSATLVDFVKACTFPCSGNQYLYWDGTCQANCSSPLTSRVYKNVNFCDYPCNDYEYLDSNGSCISGCEAPSRAVQEGGKRFCDSTTKELTKESIKESGFLIIIMSIVAAGVGVIFVIGASWLKIKITENRRLRATLNAQVHPIQKRENLDASSQALGVNQSRELPPMFAQIEFATEIQPQQVNEEEGVKVEVISP